MIDNELLKQALDETADRHFSKYDIQPEEKPHRFSLVFKIREKSITKLSKKPEKNTHSYMPLKRLAVMIAVISVIAALGIAAGAVDKRFQLCVHSVEINGSSQHDYIRFDHLVKYISHIVMLNALMSAVANPTAQTVVYPRVTQKDFLNIISAFLCATQKFIAQHIGIAAFTGTC